jgi:NAD(P)-dependent dehydrogenase (short-subunit alcohol dehydrogenase family)
MTRRAAIFAPTSTNSSADNSPTATTGDRAATVVAADVRDPDQVEALNRAVVDRHGRLDVLINKAGGSPPADWATVSPRFVAAIITLNLVAHSSPPNGPTR